MRAIAGAALVAAALLLAGCGGKADARPPENYTLDGSSLPSLNSVVELDPDVQFSREQDGEDGAESYVYSGLSQAGQDTQKYLETLEKDWDCRVGCSLTDGSAPDFSAEEGQAVAVQETDDPDTLFVLRCQWKEDSCTVIPEQTAASELDWPETDSVTLKQAVEYLQGMSPAQLGLTGSSMQEYTVFAQEGTVYLDDTPCLCLNVYRAKDHQFAQSYLLTLPGMELYQLDRQTGEAFPLNGSAS